MLGGDKYYAQKGKLWQGIKDQSKMNVGCNIKQLVKFGFNEKVSKIDMVIRKQLSKISKGGTGLN